jgi:hypothetical protein
LENPIIVTDNFVTYQAFGANGDGVAAELLSSIASCKDEN